MSIHFLIFILLVLQSLTNRSILFLNTIDWRYNDPILYLHNPHLPTAAKHTFMFYSTWSNFFRGDFKAHGKQVFLEHYDTVRALAPAERLLEYKARDGWGPLCAFSDVEEPEVGFPVGNDVGGFKKVLRTLDWMRVWEVVRVRGFGVWSLDDGFHLMERVEIVE